MTLDALLDKAAGGGINSRDVAAAGAATGSTDSEVVETCVRIIAERFLQGLCTWDYGDAVMNGLYSYAYVGSDTELSRFAFDVYEAFDAGEIADNPDDRTRDLLRRAFLQLSQANGEAPSA